MTSILYHFRTRKTEMYIIHAPDSSKWKVISYRPCTLINTYRSETMHELASPTGNRLNTWTCHLTPLTIPLGVIP